MLIDLVAGARPNFMKVAPLYHALRAAPGFEPRFVHAGQHYDAAMSAVFLEELGLPAPDVDLHTGSGTHGEQTARALVAYEAHCLADRPDWTVVVGDVNSTLACALAAQKLGVKVAHLEAGLRSGDMSMPEEVNRRVTDAIADLLWTPSADADEALLAEGVAPHRIERVGNVMIDSVERMRARIEAARFATSLGLARGGYVVLTVHRPTNVDSDTALAGVVEAVCDLAAAVPVVFPVHPRTRERLVASGLLPALVGAGTVLLDPLPYVPFLSLVSDAALVVTDSGGVQEETTYLGVPCATVRETTERPITILEGTNRLAAWSDLPRLAELARSGG